MRNRQLYLKKLEYVESILINLSRIVKTKEPVETYLKNIQQAQETVGELQDMVEGEGVDPREINRI